MIIPNLPYKEYQEIDAINKSTLDLVDESPALVQWNRDCPVDNEANDAAIFGNAFHCIVLEPDKFEHRYIVSPKCDRRTKEGKAIYEEFQNECGNKILLDQKTMRQLDLMRGSVMAHPDARRFVESSQKEVSFVCDHGKYKTKSRHDMFIEKVMVSLDLKTLDPGNKPFWKAWGEAVTTRRYDVQEHHYRQDAKKEFGEDLNDFLFVVVSKSLSLGRYETHVMRLTKELREQGRHSWEQNMNTMLRCQESGKFPGIETTITPAYAMREM